MFDEPFYNQPRFKPTVKFQVTGDYNGIVEARSMNDAQAIIIDKLKAKGLRKWLFKLLKIKDTYEFELRLIQDVDN